MSLISLDALLGSAIIGVGASETMRNDQVPRRSPDLPEGVLLLRMSPDEYATRVSADEIVTRRGNPATRRDLLSTS